MKEVKETKEGKSFNGNYVTKENLRKGDEKC